MNDQHDRDGSKGEPHASALEQELRCLEQALDRSTEADLKEVSAPAERARLAIDEMLNERSAGGFDLSAARRRFETDLEAQLAFERQVGQAAMSPQQASPSSIERRGERSSVRFARWLPVAAALLVGLVLGRSWQQGLEVRQLRTELADSRERASLALLDHRRATERLEAISWLSDSTGSLAGRDAALTERLLEALLITASQDPSENVRLAAIEALAPHARRPQVGEGLLRALREETSPVVAWEAARVALRTLPASMDRDIEMLGLDQDTAAEILKRVRSGSAGEPATGVRMRRDGSERF